MIAVAGGARANIVVPVLLAATGLERRDRALVTELVYGASRMQRACDWLADRYVRGRTDDEVRAALRLGVYQLLWTRIPPHAAVSATVAEVRGPGRSLVNAVLRRVAAQLDAGPVRWPDPATELSYPDWLVARLVEDLGPEPAFEALRTMNLPAEMTVRPDGYVQDLASQMVVEHLGVGSGDVVLDLCAAPGGKATGLAALGAALVLAADVSVARARVLAANAKRLGLPAVSTVVADGAVGPWREGTFDRVLVDAPCSGLGVLRRRPDARWRVEAGDLGRLAALQRRLLGAGARALRPGGTLAYSVCTLSLAETAGIDSWLAAELREWVPLQPPGAPWRPAGRGALLLPQDAGTDGMYLLCLRAPG